MTLHPHKLVKDAQATIARQGGIVQDDLEHAREGKVAGVDGKALTVRAVKAGLAAAQLAGIGDVVVDERGALEQLDGHAGGKRLLSAASHGLGSQQGEDGAHALAAAGGEVREGLVQVPVEVSRGGVDLCHGRGVRLVQGALDERQLLAQVRDEGLSRVGVCIAHVRPFRFC